VDRMVEPPALKKRDDLTPEEMRSIRIFQDNTPSVGAGGDHAPVLSGYVCRCMGVLAHVLQYLCAWVGGWVELACVASRGGTTNSFN
jgi:hypothetical protein